jgi:hypothetical protein
MLGISWLLDDPLASHEGLCSMRSVTYAIKVSNPSGIIIRQEEHCVVGYYVM